MQKVVLPNHQAVWAPNAVEAAVVYREVVAESTYLSHGIALEPNAVVFDVGANVGLFAIHLPRVVPGVRVHAFEPIPELFEALQRNAAEHAPSVRVYNVGVAAHEGDAVFEVDRFMTISASMHPRVFDRRPGVSGATWLAAALDDASAVTPSRTLTALSAGLASRVWRPFVLIAMAPFLALLGLRRRIYLRRPRCKLITLSQALATSGESHIDLLKIDVEGAEEDVLAGIGGADWPRINQLVIEVHDVDGRFDRMSRLLESHGFHVTRAREDWKLHELLQISTLYATRPAAA
ncbi:MAG TPA: FkbM family methyltransferase [Gemmatimonadaceae bacterium]|nr:FkbM family methyltransferase [Gemmatimonadaceae bacterium]